MGALPQPLKLDSSLPANFITKDNHRPNCNQNIQNEQPLTNLSNKISKQFKNTITASKNLMKIQQKIHANGTHIKESTITTPQETYNFPFHLDHNQESLLFPVFEVLNRMKVKKPIFEMIQIDHKKFVKTKLSPISMDYDLMNEIGKGGFGCVFRGRDKKTSQIRAIKKISKQCLGSEERQLLANEFEILCKLDHPNIIKLYDIYEDSKDLYVVTELCEGGDLLKFVNSTRMTERSMRNIMIQLISAVKYMHSFSILHRDIKLENIVIVKNMVGESEKINIKLIDFGISLNLNKLSSQSDEEPLGTLLYMSPQSLNGKLMLESDMWSCGITLYMMATRKTPFNFSSDNELIHRIKRGQIVRNNLQKLSLDLKVFVMQLLDINITTRITASKALNNPWIRKQSHKSNLTVSTRLHAARNLLDYDAKNNLVSIIEAYLIYKKINQGERQRLASIFQEIDQDKSGIIEINELKKFYSQNSQHYDARQVEELLSVMDKNKSGKIDFNEFITAMCDRRTLFQMQALEQAFDFFDKDHSGEISKIELQQILQGVQHEQIQYLFTQLDKNHDFKISKTQFLTYLGKYS